MDFGAFQDVSHTEVHPDVARLLGDWDNLPYADQPAPQPARNERQPLLGGGRAADLPVTSLPDCEVIQDDHLFYAAVTSLGGMGIVMALHVYTRDQWQVEISASGWLIGWLV